MADTSTHATQMARKRTLMLRELLPELPEFCADFFRGIESQTSALTRLSYAYDLRLFFQYVCSNVRSLKNKQPSELTCEDLDLIQPVDLEKFSEYIALYYKERNTDSDAGILPERRTFENGEAGRQRKLSSVRSLYRYLYKRQWVQNNPAALVDLPKLHEKEIIRLEPDEVARLLDEVENADDLSEKQQQYHRKTRLRDLALLTLLLGTGIRVSECVGLDLSDIDFENGSFRITRKGGDQVILYFGEEVSDALQNYLDERLEIVTQPGHENAFFLSLQKRRLEVRSVEKLVKKYAQVAAPLKKISPHKLRSTFGTTLYQETGDIYLVADVLGHSDVNTTRRHYAAMSDENRRRAAHAVKLRDDPNSLSEE